jgi:hypothetical protein
MRITPDDAQSIVVILGGVSAFIVSVGTFVMQYIANRRLQKLKETGEERGAQITAVHDLVNGQSEQLLSLTAKASHAEGAKDERDAAEGGEHV